MRPGAAQIIILFLALGCGALGISPEQWQTETAPIRLPSAGSVGMLQSKVAVGAPSFIQKQCADAQCTDCTPYTMPQDTCLNTGTEGIKASCSSDGTMLSVAGYANSTCTGSPTHEQKQGCGICYALPSGTYFMNVCPIPDGWYELRVSTTPVDGGSGIEGMDAACAADAAKAGLSAAITWRALVGSTAKGRSDIQAYFPQAGRWVYAGGGAMSWLSKVRASDVVATCAAGTWGSGFAAVYYMDGRSTVGKSVWSGMYGNGTSCVVSGSNCHDWTSSSSANHTNQGQLQTLQCQTSIYTCVSVLQGCSTLSSDCSSSNNMICVGDVPTGQPPPAVPPPGDLCPQLGHVQCQKPAAQAAGCAWSSSLPYGSGCYNTSTQTYCQGGTQAPQLCPKGDASKSKCCAASYGSTCVAADLDCCACAHSSPCTCPRGEYCYAGWPSCGDTCPDCRNRSMLQ